MNKAMVVFCATAAAGLSGCGDDGVDMAKCEDAIKMRAAYDVRIEKTWNREDVLGKVGRPVYGYVMLQNGFGAWAPYTFYCDDFPEKKNLPALLYLAEGRMGGNVDRSDIIVNDEYMKKHRPDIVRGLLEIEQSFRAQTLDAERWSNQ